YRHHAGRRRTQHERPAEVGYSRNMSLPATLRFGNSLVKLAIGAAILGVAAGGCNKQITDRDIEPISLTEVRALVERPGSALLIDPRPPSAFAAGHLPGARNMQLADVRPERGVDPALDRYGQLVV